MLFINLDNSLLAFEFVGFLALFEKFNVLRSSSCPSAQLHCYPGKNCADHL